MNVRMMTSLRWAFRCCDWQPTKAEWMLAAQSVQPEEKTRIIRFLYQRDAKYAMIGRLMIRKGVSEQLGIPYKDVRLERSPKGKPFVANDEMKNLKGFSFNVSHQGAYTIMAVEPDCPVGVDVMDYERPKGSKSVDDFFRQMERQLTEHEWSFIKAGNTEDERLARFYRHWCLKESYVKALGIGIGFDLQRIEFHIKSSTLHRDHVTSDTEVYIDGELEENWLFQESLLDDTHCVAVGMECQNPKKKEPILFKELTFSELTSGCQPLSEPDEEYWETFRNKEVTPNIKQ